MAHPFLPVPQEPSTQGHGARSCEGIQSLQLLVAPDGQLSADGQLRAIQLPADWLLEQAMGLPPAGLATAVEPMS